MGWTAAEGGGHSCKRSAEHEWAADPLVPKEGSLRPRGPLFQAQRISFSDHSDQVRQVCPVIPSPLKAEREPREGGALPTLSLHQPPSSGGQALNPTRTICIRKTTRVAREVAEPRESSCILNKVLSRLGPIPGFL